MKEEMWKDIPGYEGFYQISSMGRIKSLDRYYKTGRGGIVFKKEKILKPNIDKYGYYKIGLCKEGKQKHFKVHRLVYFSFHPDADRNMQVNHIDENKLNNILTNLNLLSPKANNNWGTRNNRISKTQINDKRKSKPVLQLNLNGNIINEYPSIKEAVRCTGIKSKEISLICRNVKGHYTAGGYKWLFKKDWAA